MRARAICCRPSWCSSACSWRSSVRGYALINLVLVAVWLVIVVRHRARTQETGPGRSRQRCGLSGDSYNPIATLAVLAAGLAGICAGAGIARRGAPPAARRKGDSRLRLTSLSGLERAMTIVEDRAIATLGTRGPLSASSAASRPAAASRSAPAFATVRSSGITARSMCGPPAP